MGATEPFTFSFFPRSKGTTRRLIACLDSPGGAVNEDFCPVLGHGGNGLPLGSVDESHAFFMKLLTDGAVVGNGVEAFSGFLSHSEGFAHDRRILFF